MLVAQPLAHIYTQVRINTHNLNICMYIPDKANLNKTMCVILGVLVLDSHLHTYSHIHTRTHVTYIHICNRKGNPKQNYVR